MVSKLIITTMKSISTFVNNWLK